MQLKSKVKKSFALQFQSRIDSVSYLVCNILGANCQDIESTYFGHEADYVFSYQL